jgi:hypothetical protein
VLARCDYANGFRTTDNFSTQAMTALLFCNDPQNAAGTALAANSIKMISMNSGAFFQYWPSASEQTFVTGTGTGVDTVNASSFGSTGGQNAPGVTPYMKKPRLRCITDTGTAARLTLQDGAMLKEFTGTTGGAGGLASTPISFGGAGFAADSVIDAQAILYYRRALSFAEVQAVWDFVMDDLVARGFPR